MDHCQWRATKYKTKTDETHTPKTSCSWSFQAPSPLFSWLKTLSRRYPRCPGTAAGQLRNASPGWCSQTGHAPLPPPEISPSYHKGQLVFSSQPRLNQGLDGERVSFTGGWMCELISTTCTFCCRTLHHQGPYLNVTRFKLLWLHTRMNLEGRITIFCSVHCFICFLPPADESNPTLGRWLSSSRRGKK